MALSPKDLERIMRSTPMHSNKQLDSFADAWGQNLRQNLRESKTKPKTNLRQPPSKSKTNLRQTDVNLRQDADKSKTTDVVNLRQEENEQSITENSCSHEQANLRQNDVVLDLEGDCLRFNERLSYISEGVNLRQNDVVLDFERECLRLKSETEISDKLRQHPPLPTSHQQLQILVELHTQQDGTGLGHTPRINHVRLAKQLGISVYGLYKQVQRLVADGYLVRVDARAGRSSSGTIYKIPIDTSVAIASDINLRHKPKTNLRQNLRQTVRSSSSDLTTTTDRRALIDELAIVCDQSGLTQYGIGANDLIDILRKHGWETVEERALLVESAHHLGFKLLQPDAKSIKDPKAWVLSKLRAGYYAPPPGYVSWEERQFQARLEVFKAEQERKKALHTELVNTAFTTWERDLTLERRSKILGPCSPGSDGALSMLRCAFREETGMSWPE